MKLAAASLRIPNPNAPLSCLSARAYARAGVLSSFAKPIFAALLAVALFILPCAVFADSNPANDSASIEISITPSVDRGVLITTDTPGMLDLGNIEMGVSTQTVYPATVTILGTVSNTELNLSANIEGGWIFDDNLAIQEQDRLQAWSVFKTTASATPPSKSGSNFDDANDALSPAVPSASFGPARVGLANGDTGNNDRFEDGSVNMDSLNPNTQRHWWFYFRTPPATSTANTQRVTFILSVEAGP